MRFNPNSLPEQPIDPPTVSEGQYRDNLIRGALETALEKLAGLDEALSELRWLDKEGCADHFKAMDQVRRCDRIEALGWLKEDLNGWMENMDDPGD